MRLLLRRSAYTRAEGPSWRIAASPDHWSSDRWQWDLWLTSERLDAASETGIAVIAYELGQSRHESHGSSAAAFALRYDSGNIAVDLVELKLEGELRVSRDPGELWVMTPVTQSFREGA